jgi:3',5'-cyclic AMP phosphodiesterase CpdA
MPDSSPLATFVHISDLHFGTLIQDPQGDLAPDAPVYHFWRLFPWCDGLLGHHYRALGPLSDFVKRLRKTENARVIVTGDLTSNGAPDQFDTCVDFLVSQLPFPPNSVYRSVGLFEKGWQERAIPGNHDHWPGTHKIVGKPTSALRSYFPSLPYVSPAVPLSSGQRVRFVGIDTDADVNPYFTARIRARGSFTSQLGPAAALLGDPAEDEVRILLMHHSRVWPQYTLGIEDASRAALDVFLADQNIRVVLTGHIHVPALDIFTPRPGAPSVLEARCGTTTVRDLFPYTWTTLAGGPIKRTLPPNSLLVHRVSERDGELWWEAEAHTRTALGFRPFGTAWRTELRVWP